MRSAVGVGRLPQSIVPDNGRTIGLLQNIAGNVRAGLDKRKASSLYDDLLSQASQNVSPEQPSMSFEERQGQLAQGQIDLAEEQQVQQTQQMAQQKRDQVQRETTWRTLTSNPEMQSKMSELMQLDPNMAKSVANILVSRDQQQIEGLQQEAVAANKFNLGLVQLATDPKVTDDDLLKYRQDRARYLQERGAPIDELASTLSMGRDELVSYGKRKLALTKGGYDVAELAKNELGINKINPNDFTPESLQAFSNSGGDYSLLEPRKETPAINPSTQRSNDLRERELNFKQSKLSSVAERELFKAQDAAQSSQSQVSQLESVAQEYENLAGQMGSGRSANVSETLKTFFGNEDAVTNLRRRYNRIVNKRALDNLPPGAASEKDVEIVFQGFLPDSANPQQIASFMRGMAKVEQANYEYESFKADYISEKGNSRGLQSAWKDKRTSDNQSSALDQARRAIQSGAPRDAVIQRLKQQGISAEGL